MNDNPASGFLAGYPVLAGLVDQLDRYLEQNHPKALGKDALHPFLPVKRSKVIHDNVWGTVRFSWREMALIDSPIMQRLRDIHQTGLAYHVYPSARHSRFEHSLGAAIVASRVFDALLHRQRNDIRDVAKVVDKTAETDNSILRFKQELRLAALLHDTGHSLFSHTSERVYEKLDPLIEATNELSSFLGKEKGAGEVLSFCIALTPAVRRLLERAERKLVGDVASDDYDGPIDLANVALLIVGRSKHPFLQFLGDIVSSGFDADKLDYLLRDAKGAGLPLRYDIDRYLYDVRVEKQVLTDDSGGLQKLYSRVGTTPKRHQAAGSQPRYPYYDTYRLRLSRRAMNVIEQIMICKMMLFSYIYHHSKCRAAEGLLERLLNRKLSRWRKNGESDNDILLRFLEMTDASLIGDSTADADDQIISDYTYRIINRLVPRELYSIGGPPPTHAEGELIGEFLLDIQERKERNRLVGDLERAIGEELVKLDQDLGPDPIEATAQAGVWVDAPKPPKFEDVDETLVDAGSASMGVPLADVFPIREWTQAYQAYRYQVRIFAFSEYWDTASKAAKAAMQRVLNISSDSFYDGIRRGRG